MFAEVVKFDSLPAESGIRFRHDGHDFEVRADRIVRDGKEVAVLVSPGFGAGFITWNEGISPFEPKLVALVLAGKQKELHDADPADVAAFLGLVDEDGSSYVSLHGADDLVIQYVPLGTAFEYDEYDGSESLRILGGPPKFVA